MKNSSVAVLHRICPAVLTSVVGGGGIEGQALSAQGRPGLDPGVVVGIILAISAMTTTGLLLEVVLAHLWLLVMCNGHRKSETTGETETCMILLKEKYTPTRWNG